MRAGGCARRDCTFGLRNTKTTARSPGLRKVFLCMLVSLQRESEVILERKVNPVVVENESIGVVRAPAPLKFPAHHYPLDRVVEQIGERILPASKSIRRLTVTIVDAEPGVAYRTGERFAPGVIEKRDNP